MKIFPRTCACTIFVLAAAVAGCDDNAATDGGSRDATPGAAATPSATAPSNAGATSPEPKAGISLAGFEDVLETPAGKLADDLRVDGPAAAFLSSSPLPGGPRKWLALFVFPKGTDPATICESNFPGPVKKDEYIIGLDGQYDGELKVGPMVSGGSPSVSYLSQSDDGNVTSAAIGKPDFVELHVTALEKDTVSVRANAKPGAPFRLEASFTAKICRDE